MAFLDSQWLTNDIYTGHLRSKNLIIEHHEELHTEQCSEKSSPVSPSSSRASESPQLTSILPKTNLVPLHLNQPRMYQPPAFEADYGKHPLHDSQRRPLHVVIAGAGPSGIAMAIELIKLENVTFEIFEKNSDVGGTWLENRYPGAACDVASHAYQYTFEQNTDWSHHFAPAEEIGEYFKKVASKHGVYPFVKFRSRVTRATWEDSEAKWALQVTDTKTGQELAARGDIFINAGGILNDWKWPDIEGLDTFQGRRLHTADWDQSISLGDQRIGIIGSGATSVQVVPSIQKTVRQLKVFVRSPTYILPTIGFGVESSTFNEQYTEEQKRRFREDPSFYKMFRKKIEQQMNENFGASIKGSESQKEGRRWAEEMMRKSIASKELQDKLVPSWELGCRRITPGLPYLNAVQQSNVDIIRTPIESICERGICTSDGLVHELDVLICATGFDTSFSSRYDIVGEKGRSLRASWKDSVPEAYLGLAVSGYPNYFTILGPNCPIANGSLVPCIEASAKYIKQVVEKIQRCQIRTMNVKANMQRALNDYIQRVHRDLVWTGSCSSWYKDKPTGKITAVWPGSSIHFMEVIEQPRWEDFEIEYQEQGNPFIFLGDGRSQREYHKKDLTYYLD